MDRVRNEEVIRRAGIERVLTSTDEQRVLGWFGQGEKMDEYHMARLVLMAEVSGDRVIGRLWLGWMDGLKVALGNGRIMVQAVRQRAKDGTKWRALEHMQLISFRRSFLLCVLSDPPPVVWWLSLERSGMR